MVKYLGTAGTLVLVDKIKLLTADVANTTTELNAVKASIVTVEAMTDEEIDTALA